MPLLLQFSSCRNSSPLSRQNTTFVWKSIILAELELKNSSTYLLIIRFNYFASIYFANSAVPNISIWMLSSYFIAFILKSFPFDIISFALLLSLPIIIIIILFI
jgi:hypothetical protein